MSNLGGAMMSAGAMGVGNALSTPAAGATGASSGLGMAEMGGSTSSNYNLVNGKLTYTGGAGAGAPMNMMYGNPIGPQLASSSIYANPMTAATNWVNSNPVNMNNVMSGIGQTVRSPWEKLQEWQRLMNAGWNS